MKGYFSEKSNVISFIYWMSIFMFVAFIWAIIEGIIPESEIPKAFIKTITVKEYHILEKEKEVEVIKYIHSDMKTHKFITHLNPKIDPDIAKQIGKGVDKYSEKYQLPKKLILSIMYKESTFNPFAKSKVAYGLMQIYPKYHKEKIKSLGITDKRKLYHIDNNINLGCWIFSEYLNKAKGDLDEAFHRYLSKNASEKVKNRYKNAILNTWSLLEYFEYKG